VSAWRERPRTASQPPDPALPELTGVSAVPPWLEPYPDILLDGLVDQVPGPGARYGSTEAISLAFITALQLLRPRQRAALVLRDGHDGAGAVRDGPVLGYHGAEVAQMLDTTLESVTSALKRARATVDNHLADSSSTDGLKPSRQPDTAAEHRLVARFTGALECADLDALIDLLVTDVRLSMPPAMLEYRGIESAHRVLAAVTLPPRPHLPRWYPAVPTASPPSACTWQTPTPASTAPTASWSSPPPATASPPSPPSAPPSCHASGYPGPSPKQTDRLLTPPGCPHLSPRLPQRSGPVLCPG
jgi:RNA polymerase sigma-70 factor (ECF subfamily)